jgi:hypothetical protein
MSWQLRVKRKCSDHQLPLTIVLYMQAASKSHWHSMCCRGMKSSYIGCLHVVCSLHAMCQMRRSACNLHVWCPACPFRSPSWLGAVHAAAQRHSAVCQMTATWSSGKRHCRLLWSCHNALAAGFECSCLMHTMLISYVQADLMWGGPRSRWLPQQHCRQASHDCMQC